MLKKVDWHIHSVDHNYFMYGQHFNGLTEQDKRQIRMIVDWAADRGLDYAAITDHDLVAPGLYAAEYAKQYSKIKIIPGIECEILMKTIGHMEVAVHILGHGVKEQPDYVKNSTIEEVIKAIHAAGGVAALAHPVGYPRYFFDDCKELFDGVEVFNGTRHHIGNKDPFNPNPEAGRFDPGDDFKGLRLYGSDKHYEHRYIRAHHEAVSEHEEEIVERIINGKH